MRVCRRRVREVMPFVRGAGVILAAAVLSIGASGCGSGGSSSSPPPAPAPSSAAAATGSSSVASAAPATGSAPASTPPAGAGAPRPAPPAPPAPPPPPAAASGGAPTAAAPPDAAAVLKIDSQLLAEIHRAEGRPAPPVRTNVRIDDHGRALVDVRAVVTPALEQTVTRAGGTIVSTSERDHSILAWVPLGRIEALAGDSAIRAIVPAAQAIGR